MPGETNARERKGEIIEKSLKVYFAANPHFLWKHFVFDDFGITRGISK